MKLPAIIVLSALVVIGAQIHSAPGQAQNGTKTDEICAPPLHTVRSSNQNGSGFHTLDEEPPASLTATVYDEVDGCPVVLVLDPADGSEAGWRSVPGPGHRLIR